MSNDKGVVATCKKPKNFEYNTMTKVKEPIETKSHAYLSGVMRSLLYKYIDWERMWYNPKPIPVGSLVKSNWKARVYFYGSDVVDLIDEPLEVKSIDDDNVVTTSNDNSYNAYWLKRI